MVQVGSIFFFYPVGGSSGPALSYGGAPFVAGQFGGWTPIGVEQTASGYEVAWKVTGADQYTVWNTDSSGNYTSNAIGTVPGSSVAAFEPSFQQDLNGDNVIGPPPPPPPTGILPPDRQTLWQPGVTYNTSGIPDRTDIFMTLSPSGGDDTAAIQAALDGCPPGTVVQLTAGVFNITGNGLHIISANCTLRGGLGKDSARASMGWLLMFVVADLRPIQPPLNCGNRIVRRI